jgi:hypothetical protein
MPLLLLLAVATAAAVPHGAVNCSAAIGTKECSCADNNAAQYPASRCAMFGDFCKRGASCPRAKHCQWDPRLVPVGSFAGGCVDDVACGNRSTAQDCVCLTHPGSHSDCLWSADHGSCEDREPWDSAGGKCSATKGKAECLATEGNFSCSWSKVCKSRCGGRARCCEWADPEQCHFEVSQPRCAGPDDEVHRATEG